MRKLEGIFWKPGINGLGVAAFGKLNNLLPYRYRFDDAARWHDCNYDRGGNSADRKQADVVFLHSMFAVCVNPLQYTMATVYYFAVRLLGGLFYNYKEDLS